MIASHAKQMDVDIAIELMSYNPWKEYIKLGGYTILSEGNKLVSVTQIIYIIDRPVLFNFTPANKNQFKRWGRFIALYKILFAKEWQNIMNTWKRG